MFVSEKIAFHAYLASTILETTYGQTIVFNQVDTNLGGGYSGTTGVFTAPVAGTYVFSLTFEMYYYSSHASNGELYIMKNQDQSIRVWLELDNNADEGTASGTTVLSLNKGDQVYVQTCILAETSTVTFQDFSSVDHINIYVLPLTTHSNICVHFKY